MAMPLILLGVVGCLVVALLAAWLFTFDMKQIKQRKRLKKIYFAAVFPTAWVVLNVVVLVSSLAPPYTPVPTSIDAAREFGLESNVEYELVLGSRFGGTSVEAESNSGLFFANSYISSKPASALSVGFVHGDKSYILDIPVSKITFVQTQEKTPSVSLRISEVKFAGIDTRIEYDNCNFSFVNLYALCSQPITRATYTLSEKVERRGLAPIVAAYLDSATVTLTHEMYDTILGRSG